MAFFIGGADKRGSSSRLTQEFLKVTFLILLLVEVLPCKNSARASLEFVSWDKERFHALETNRHLAFFVLSRRL